MSPFLLWLLLFATDLVLRLVIIVGFVPLSPSEQLSRLLRSHELLCCGCMWLIIPLAFIKSVDWHSGREAAGPEGPATEGQQDLCPTVCVGFGHVRLLSSKIAIYEWIFYSWTNHKASASLHARLSKKKTNKPKSNIKNHQGPGTFYYPKYLAAVADLFLCSGNQIRLVHWSWLLSSCWFKEINQNSQMGQSAFL